MLSKRQWIATIILATAGVSDAYADCKTFTGRITTGSGVVSKCFAYNGYNWCVSDKVTDQTCHPSNPVGGMSPNGLPFQVCRSDTYARVKAKAGC